jgi:hypothetical protein
MGNKSTAKISKFLNLIEEFYLFILFLYKLNDLMIRRALESNDKHRKTALL